MRLIFFFLWVALANACIGQQQINIFPNLSGDVLLQSVLDNYKTTTTLDYGNARDTLYGKIDAVNDTLECAYSGYKVYLTPGADPTTVAFNAPGGGINAEHGYPQSKGASTGIGRSDMHHLYPTRSLVNSARMSNPLLDIPDNETTSWFMGTVMVATKPTTNINAYSESTATKFEPREKSKGNLARSIFYFYTMYKEQCTTADPNFFGIQKSTLCQWHNDDPVDPIEWKRTYGIAKHQQNKPNPFVIDCSLVSRLYCSNIDQACEELVHIATAVEDDVIKNNMAIYPNPTADHIWISGLSQNVEVSMMDLSGRIIEQRFFSDVEGAVYLEWTSMINPGLYVVKVSQSNSIKPKYFKLLISNF